MFAFVLQFAMFYNLAKEVNCNVNIMSAVNILESAIFANSVTYSANIFFQKKFCLNTIQLLFFVKEREWNHVPVGNKCLRSVF